MTPSCMWVTSSGCGRADQGGELHVVPAVVEPHQRSAVKRAGLNDQVHDESTVLPLQVGEAIVPLVQANAVPGGEAPEAF